MNIRLLFWAVSSTALLLTSCADDQLTEIEENQQEADALLIPEDAVIEEVEALQLNGSCQINGIPAPPASCEAPDGMILIGGPFDPNKKSVILAHGWIPDYEMGVPDFPNAVGWQAEGFNTFIFRYINKASDAGAGGTCVAGGALLPIFGDTSFDCPKDAEPRVWAHGGQWRRSCERIPIVL
ncbi:MAG: hypothetical protein HRU19_02605 [Pseudobacteriovorax sp.]|nr:hypothetical protein [Pseudobacteriovorax sp.]